MEELLRSRESRMPLEVDHRISVSAAAREETTWHSVSSSRVSRDTDVAMPDELAQG
jgi:hypothetical protein